MVPPKYRKPTFHILRDVKTGMNHYFRGQALVALIVGICFSIGFIIVGLPLAVILGMFIGLLNLVPYLQLISLVPTTLLCIVYTANSSEGFWEIWWSCMAVYVVVQCIQDLFLTPKNNGKGHGAESRHHIAVAVGMGHIARFYWPDNSAAAYHTSAVVLRPVYNQPREP